MKPNIVIIDYGCGNILSLSKAVEACGAKVVLSNQINTILAADKVILPGVGAFGHCISKIKEYGIDETLQIYFSSGKPLLGICVGMQMLLTNSYEHGEHKGLDYISGKVVKISNADNIQFKKIPFVGWAKINLSTMQNSMINLSSFDSQWLYFVHSYVAKPNDQKTVAGSYHYFEEDITAIIEKDNVIGCQFHPEKSGKTGLKFLDKFVQF